MARLKARRVSAGARTGGTGSWRTRDRAEHLERGPETSRAVNVTDYLSYWAAGKLALIGEPAAAYDVARHRAVEFTVARLQGPPALPLSSTIPAAGHPVQPAALHVGLRRMGWRHARHLPACHPACGRRALFAFAPLRSDERADRAERLPDRRDLHRRSVASPRAAIRRRHHSRLPGHQAAARAAAAGRSDRGAAVAGNRRRGGKCGRARAGLAGAVRDRRLHRASSRSCRSTGS